MLTLKEITSELGNFNKTELKNLRGRINEILNTTNGGNDNGHHKMAEVVDKEERYFKQILILYAKKHVSVPSDFVIEENSYKLDTNLTTISKEIKVLTKSLKLDKRQSIKLCKVVLEAALANIEEKGKPLSFNILVNFMKNPRSLLDESWPGYVGTELWKNTVLA